MVYITPTNAEDNMALLLTASHLEAVVDMPSTIAAIESIFREIGRGTAHQPAPTAMHLPSSESNFVVMSGLADGPGLAAVKLLSDIPSNSHAGLPTQRSTILLADKQTGETLAILDGRVPTKVRTAAASAVASKYLARAGSSTLGLIGAGALAAAHLEAMLEVFPIDTVIVWSRTHATVESFRGSVAHLDVKVLAAVSIREVLEAADIVCTLTPSVVPVVEGGWLLPGLHLNAVGARPRTAHREIDSLGMARSRVFVDSMATAVAKSGDLLLAVEERAMTLDDVVGELGDVVSGTNPGRRSDTEITLFNSVGVGALDLAIGRILYDAARERDIGLAVNMSG